MEKVVYLPSFGFGKHVYLPVVIVKLRTHCVCWDNGIDLIHDSDVPAQIFDIFNCDLLMNIAQ